MAKLTIQYLWTVIFTTIALALGIQGYYPISVLIILMGIYWPLRELVNDAFKRILQEYNKHDFVKVGMFAAIALGPLMFLYDPKFVYLAGVGLVVSVYLDVTKS